MPKSKLPHLNHERDRHGKMRWYVRVRHGRRIALPGAYGSVQFMDAYKAAVLETPFVMPSQKAKHGSLSWLVARWKEHSDWLNAAASTRRQRENILKHVLEKSGDRDYGLITKADIRQAKEDRKDTPFAANNFLKTMTALFKWAVEEELLTENPCEGVKQFRPKTGGHPTWTVDEVERYRAHYALGTRERLALEVLINTGLRRGDLVRVGPHNASNGLISIVTEKTGVQLYIPILPKLQEALDATATGERWVCHAKTGRPIAKESFGTMFRLWCNAAGVAKRAHGLRKLCTTMIADDGASEMELQALFGWLTNDQSAIYTKEANKKRLALQAAMRLIAAEGDDEDDKEGTVREQGALTLVSACPNPKNKAA